MADGDRQAFHWPRLFQKSAEPLFVLNRRRQIVFVNQAWENLTGFSLAQVKGQTCRRRSRGIVAEKLDIILNVLAPSPEVLDGAPGESRRQVAGSGWRVLFFPLKDADGTLAILGRILLGAPRQLSAPEPPLPEKLLELRQKYVREFHVDRLVGESPATERLAAQIRLAASSRTPVLLVGEAGTGKHWAARAIHQHGPLNDRGFVHLDCAHLPADSVADVLFGRADGVHLGTIYLDGPEHLPGELQDRIARTEDGDPARPRFLAGTETAPGELEKARRLSEEMCCRFTTLVIPLTPLRERRDDVLLWVERFLERIGAALEKTGLAIAPEAMELLRAHAWPENLDELYRVLFSASTRCGERIEVADLPLYLRQTPPPEERPIQMDVVLEQVERRLIAQALKLARSNKSRAAEMLGIWRPRLLRRMEALGIADQDKSAEKAASEGEKAPRPEAEEPPDH